MCACSQLLLIIGLAQALVVFRVIASVVFAKHENWPFLSENSSTVAFMLTAVLHYLTITIMTWVKKISLFNFLSFTFVNYNKTVYFPKRHSFE